MATRRKNVTEVTFKLEGLGFGKIKSSQPQGIIQGEVVSSGKNQVLVKAIRKKIRKGKDMEDRKRMRG